MTSRTKKIVIILAIAILAVTVLAACDATPTLDGQKDKYNLSAVIAYHANGGSCDNQRNVATLYYQDGDMPLEYDGKSEIQGNLVIKREGYDLLGWYYPAKDTEGNIIYIDEDKDIVELSDKKYDFSVPMKSGDEIDIYAKWLPKKNVKVLLAADTRLGADSIVYKETTYTCNSTDSVLIEYPFDTNNRVEEPKYDPITSKRSAPTGYVLVGFYNNQECTEEVEWPIRRTEEEGDVYIYARYFTSDWKIIEEASDVAQMFNHTADNSGKYYVKNDIVALATSSIINISANTSFSGIIEGNGHTIEGFSFRVLQPADGSQISLLGRITADANISDLTIKDFQGSLIMKENTSVSLYFLTLAVEEGATVDGLKLDGGSLTVSSAENASWNAPADNLCPVYSAAYDGIEIINNPTVD